ncbi:MAG: hypothetical protein FWD34_04705 [Oscillospiraceae bacterium]|nr:hypothetical protein [Oscillospiraceae bacterium]
MSFEIKSGSFTVTKTVRLPEKMVEEMEQLASKENISFNKLVVQCCEYALENLNKEEAN